MKELFRGFQGTDVKEIVFFAVSVFASFVSSNNSYRPLKKTIIMSCFFAATVGVLLYSKDIGSEYIRTYVVFGVSILASSYVVYLFTARPDCRSRRGVEKDIISFTRSADTKQPIKMFGGDVDFFGNVTDGSIYKNSQFVQLENQKFRRICILCLRPVNDEDKLRIGCLLDRFNDAIDIKFFDDVSCEKCEQSYKDSVECLCRSVEGKGKGKKFHECTPFNKDPCVNPDLSIRGRILTSSESSSEAVIIIVKSKPGKEYIRKIYKSTDKECNLYRTLWNVWWTKCREDRKLRDDCLDMFKGHTPNNKNHNFWGRIIIFFRLKLL